MTKRRPPKNQSEQDFAAFLREGTAALQRGQAEKARNLLERAHRLQPEDFSVTLNLAGACILTKNFKQAIDLLEPLSEREPADPMVWTNLGAAYLGNPILAKDEHHQKAIAAFERAYAVNPKTPHVAYNLGLISRDRQETAPAIEWFKRALEADPTDKDARQYVRQLSEAGNGKN